MSRKQYPSDARDKLLIRFPEGMREQIAAMAAKNHRSMNAEIIVALERELERRKMEKAVEETLANWPKGDCRA